MYFKQCFFHNTGSKKSATDGATLCLSNARSCRNKAQSIVNYIIR